MKNSAVIPLSLFFIVLISSCTKNNINSVFSSQISYSSHGSPFPDSLILKGKTPAQKLDSITSWHNSYQATLLQKIIDKKMNLCDTINVIHLLIPEQTLSFFQST